VAKALILFGTALRYGRQIKLCEGAADARKPRATQREIYVLDRAEISRLRAALSVPFERLLVELAMTTGLRSGENRGLARELIDLGGSRLFVERQTTRRSEDAATKTQAALRIVPLPSYLVPELKCSKLACPPTPRGLVFRGEPNAQGERGSIDADVLLRRILRRALRRAGLPPLRFHDLRYPAGSFMHEAGVSLKRAQAILGHASERTTLAIYIHVMRRAHDDSADKIAQLGRSGAGSRRGKQTGNRW
jgi:integrase